MNIFKFRPQYFYLAILVFGIGAGLLSASAWSQEQEGHDHGETVEQDAEHLAEDDHDRDDHSEHNGESLEEGHNGHEDHAGHNYHAEHDDHEEHSSDAGHDGHADHDDHEERSSDANHAEHADHDDHSDRDEGGIRLTQDAIAELDMEILRAGPGALELNISLSGEVRLNGDRLAHVVPRLPGIVTEVRSSLGDSVTRGQVMAVLESRELADLKATYLAAKERLALAKATHEREARLFERKVSAESDFLEAKRDLAESKIEAQAAAQRLFALGFDDTTIAELAERPNVSLTRYEVRAPIDGMVISKHVTLGEAVADDADVYTVADLETVWVDLSVYPRDLSKLQTGQAVSVQSSGDVPRETGQIIFVGPIIGEDTRTALARVLLNNSLGNWRPGLFVEGKVVTNSEHVDIKVPHSTIQTIDSRPNVFVEHDGGFEPIVVELGLSDDQGVEVISGLEAGQRYVSRGGFFLKAELEKEAFAHSGHAH